MQVLYVIRANCLVFLPHLPLGFMVIIYSGISQKVDTIHSSGEEQNDNLPLVFLLGKLIYLLSSTVVCSTSGYASGIDMQKQNCMFYTNARFMNSILSE